MHTWLRILIAVPVGLFGIVIYLGVKWHIEKAKQLSWVEVFVGVVIGIIGLLLVGVSDFTLKPVSVPTWLRWTLIGAAGAVGLTFHILLRRLLRRAYDDDVLVIVFYAGFLLFSVLSLLFAAKEIFG